MSDPADDPPFIPTAFARTRSGTVVEIIRTRTGRAPPGTLPLYPERPAHDPRYQRLVGPNYVIEVDRVRAVWTVESAPVDTALKRREFRRLAAKRYDVETAGITWRGLPVPTDRLSQDRLGQLFQIVEAGLWPADGTFKFGDGRSRPLSAPQVRELVIGAMTHVQGAYIREAEVQDQIEAATTLEELRWSW